MQIAILAALAIEARRNIRHGRGDRKGAYRLALFVFTVAMLQWLLQANHVADVALERNLVIVGLGIGLVKALLYCWIPYIALEPYVRSHWPEMITSWTRLLAGRLRDPLVGRDLLFGIGAAVVLQLMLRLYVLIPGWLGWPPPRPESIWPDTLLGTRHMLSDFLRFQATAVFLAFGLLFTFVILRLILKSEWIAVGVTALVASYLWHPEVSALYPYLGFSITFLRMAGLVLVLRRLGVLAVVVAMFFDALLNTFPITVDLSTWYAESSIFAMVVVVGLGTYGLHTALGGFIPRPAGVE
jgi:hypothetical protein